MYFSLVLKSLKFWKLKAEKPLRYLFLVIFAARLAYNLSPYSTFDLSRVLPSDNVTDITFSQLWANFGKDGLIFLAGQLVFLLIMLLVLNLYAMVFYFDNRNSFLERYRLVLPISKPKNLVEEMRQMQAFAKIMRLKRERAVILRDLALEKEQRPDQGYAWQDPTGAPRPQTRESDYLLEVAAMPASDTPWRSAAKRLLQKLPQHLVLFVVFLAVALMSAPLLMIPFFIVLTGLAFAGLMICLKKDGFKQAMQRSWTVTKGFKLMVFSNFVILRLFISLPFSILMSIFIDSPVSYGLIEALSFTILLLAAGRLLGIMFYVVAFESSQIIGAEDQL